MIVDGRLDTFSVGHLEHISVKNIVVASSLLSAKSDNSQQTP